MSAHDQRMRASTSVIHAGQRPEPVTGAVMPPVFLSSTYAQSSPGEHSGFEYTRSHNPTRYALERMVANLEGGASGSPISEERDASQGGFAFSSGLAAMATALELLDAGSHLMCMDDVYGGSNRLLRMVRQKTQGLKVDFVDMTDVSKLEGVLTEKTGMVWVETPTNPTLKVVDIEAVSRAAHAANPDCIVVVDGTFTTPYLQRSLTLGADIAMHSVTKYLGGHSDVVGGFLTTHREDLCDRLRFVQNSIGSVMSPFDSYLTLRGIKTLALRMEQHCASASAIAAHLEGHSGVDRVVYPGLASHGQHAVARKQMCAVGSPTGVGEAAGEARHLGGGMITFFIGGGLSEARVFLESLRVFTLAESLGGVESLVEHPAIMTHASVPAEQREELGISDTLVRLSVGVESTADLLEDVDRALEAAMRGVAVGSGA